MSDHTPNPGSGATGYNADMIPPRVFNVVTSSAVQHNMDFVEYLINQEVTRRVTAGDPPLSEWEHGEFKRQLVSTLIVRGDASAAILLRPTTTRTLLNE